MSRKLRRPTPSLSSNQRLRALWICPELWPFTASSTTADAIGHLASALRAVEVDATLVLPRYKDINPLELGLAKRLITTEARIGARVETAELWEGKLSGGSRVFFLEHPTLFAPYTAQDVTPDDPARFAFLTLSALDLAQKLSLRPELIHGHSWQASLLPYFLQKRGLLPGVKSVLSIHDVRQQGVFPKVWVERLGLNWSDFNLGGFEFYDQLSFLKAGIAYADLLTAPSPRYAAELQTPAGGAKMEGILSFRGKSLVGICDGIDDDHWNPLNDDHIAQHFGPADFHGRRRCKAELQRLFRLPVRENRPIIGVIAKTNADSGLDLLLRSMDRLLSMGFQIACALQGEDGAMRDAFIRLAHEHPNAVGVSLDANERLVRKIIAGADFFLVPERYEPCGSDQMKALRYGAVPIARAVGGIPDTIDEATPTSGNGFLFSDPEEESLVAALERALKIYGDSRGFRMLQQRGMTRDFSWSTAAARYRELYCRVLGREVPAPKESDTLPDGSRRMVEKLSNPQEDRT